MYGKESVVAKIDERWNFWLQNEEKEEGMMGLPQALWGVVQQYTFKMKGGDAIWWMGEIICSTSTWISEVDCESG